jgi:hypothetical protein
MATLVLSVAGQILGGPIGSAIGSAIGQYIDQTIIFAPKARHGPRLGDLSVQTSSYGNPIPKIFGTIRAAGTVIWATDLIESRASSGGGKGQAKTINYSYAASFAVALSARPVTGIGRIWADGKLLRGAAGDFKSATLFRLHAGDEEQQADPLIAAAEGADQASGFRGIAYAVFEDFQLEAYGNRIPSLTFEVEADSDTVSIGAIAEELSGGAVAAGTTPGLSGYAASGDSVRGALEALADVVPLSLADDGETLRLSMNGGEAEALAPSFECGRREIVRRGLAAMPGEASIAYHDVGRDYQIGLQRAVRAGGRSADRRALPAVLSASGAKALAEYRLAAFWAGRVKATIRASWRASHLRAGGAVEIEGLSGRWTVERWTLGPMTVTLDLARASAGALPDLAASPGRATGEPDLPHGPTSLIVLDLPLGDGLGVKPLLFVAAAGPEEGWRRALLSASYDHGESWEAAGATALPAVIGVAVDALAPAGSALFDRVSTIEVALANQEMWLESRSDDALVDGANLAAVGDELIQFGNAEPLGDGRFRLSSLLRGRRGTEWAADGHGADELFTLIEPASLVVLEAPAGAIGGEARIMASGVGDAEEAERSIEISGSGLQPPGPVHLTARETGSGDLEIAWVRRSRQGWAWLSGSGTPLGEESELYQLAIAGDGFERIVTTATPAFAYTAAARAEDGGGPILITVRQTGTFAASRPASIAVL